MTGIVISMAADKGGRPRPEGSSLLLHYCFIEDTISTLISRLIGDSIWVLYLYMLIALAMATGWARAAPVGRRSSHLYMGYLLLGYMSIEWGRARRASRPILEGSLFKLQNILYKFPKKYLGHSSTFLKLDTLPFSVLHSQKVSGEQT